MPRGRPWDYFDDDYLNGTRSNVAGFGLAPPQRPSGAPPPPPPKKPREPEQSRVAKVADITSPIAAGLGLLAGGLAFVPHPIAKIAGGVSGLLAGVTPIAGEAVSAGVEGDPLYGGEGAPRAAMGAAASVAQGARNLKGAGTHLSEQRRLAREATTRGYGDMPSPVGRPIGAAPGGDLTPIEQMRLERQMALEDERRARYRRGAAGRRYA